MVIEDNKGEPVSEERPPLRLEIDSHVIRQLGDELITDTGQALLELVKNSYDADASYCHVAVDTRHEETIEVPQPRGVTGMHERGKDAEKSPPSHNRVFTGRLTVTDNGEGMSFETIRRGWLTISLSPKRAFKLQGRTTPIYHRTPLGDKGLGRIGTLKLGSFIVIETRDSTTKPGWRISFSWEDCEEGSLLSDVPVKSERIDATGETGTVLTIYGLSDVAYWRNKDAVASLGSQLSTLISPFKDFEAFDVRFTFDSIPAAIETAENYLNAAQGKFSATWQVSTDESKECLDVDGAIKLLLFRKTRNDPTYRRYVEPDSGEELYRYLSVHKRLQNYGLKRGKRGWFAQFRKGYLKSDLPDFFGDERFADPGPLISEIYDIDIVEAKSLVASKKTNRPRFLDTHSGIFVYRDNFRIRMGKDWLNLGERQTRGGSYYGLRPGNTLGWVSISARDNQRLVEKSDREGFVDNAAQRGFEYVLERVTADINDFITDCRRAYNDFINSKRNKEADRSEDYDDAAALEELKEVAVAANRLSATLSESSGFLEEVSDVYARMKDCLASEDYSKLSLVIEQAESAAIQRESRKNEIPGLLKRVATIPHAVETIANTFEADESQMEELYAVAATGLAAEGLVHEISDVVQALLNALTDLDKVTYVLNIKNAKFLGNIKSAQASGRDIVNRVRFLDPMLRNVRASRELINVKDFLERYEKHKRPYVEQSGIILKVEYGDASFSITANKGRVLQVLDNLVNNSVYWLKLASSARNGFSPTILIQAQDPVLRVSDNGLGVDERIVPRLFEAFVTGRKDGSGHGLGLYLSQELLKQEKSTITLLPELNPHQRRYIFEIDFAPIANE
jgi:signal transduction histidine kinase